MKLFEVASDETLDMISRHCPEALHIYMSAIFRSKDFKVVLSKETIEDDMMLTLTKVRNSLKKLALENILEFVVKDNLIEITLADVHE